LFEDAGAAVGAEGDALLDERVERGTLLCDALDMHA
jgi:hypothetical protein